MKRVTPNSFIPIRLAVSLTLGLSLNTAVATNGIITTDLNGSSDHAQALVVQTDGKILLGGSSFNISWDFAVTRYNSDGTLDTTFGNSNGITTTDFSNSTDFASALTVQSDGKVILGGTSSNGGFALVRYNSDGSLDTSFGGGDGMVTTPIGNTNGNAFALTVQPNGKILLGGTSWNDNNTDFALVRYNSDGSLDTSFGGGDGEIITDLGSSDTARTLALQSDGKIILGGYSDNNGDDDFALVRYNSDGSLDVDFDADGIVISTIESSTDQASTLALQSDGKILLGGYNYNGFLLMRYNSDGTIDSSFSNDGIATTDFGNYVEALALVTQPDDKILLTGYSHPTANNDDIALARYNSDGSPDTSFGEGYGMVTTALGNDEYAFAVAVQSDNKILIGGYSGDTGNHDFTLVRYNSNGSIDTSFGYNMIGNNDAGALNWPYILMLSLPLIWRKYRY